MGKAASPTGSFADENRFRFSTKYYDSETELSYYGFRYYSASLGRFFNRDPIEEGGAVDFPGCDIRIIQVPIKIFSVKGGRTPEL